MPWRAAPALEVAAHALRRLVAAQQQPDELCGAKRGAAAALGRVHVAEAGRSRAEAAACVTYCTYYVSTLFDARKKIERFVTYIYSIV